ncbi:MAG: hypothetical protein A2792_09830 [Sphingomonadales bacterium RIFCSPHIGHO2_01_FULL_65_20]|nr:MAG: hypothetical protein A2792_09830 [Sphingomonadales bacterium RIFCSPHIGHO2_01_FULL_65_20]
MATEGMNRAASLYNHILAVERLEDEKKDLQDDINERIKIAVDVDGFDKAAFKEIIKRRKKGHDACSTMDAMIADYEDMLQAHIDSVRDRSTKGGGAVEPQPETVDGGEVLALNAPQGALPDYTEAEPVDAEFAEVDDDPDGSADVDGAGEPGPDDDGSGPEDFDDAPW